MGISWVVWGVLWDAEKAHREIFQQSWGAFGASWSAFGISWISSPRPKISQPRDWFRAGGSAACAASQGARVGLGAAHTRGVRHTPTTCRGAAPARAPRATRPKSGRRVPDIRAGSGADSWGFANARFVGRVGFRYTPKTRSLWVLAIGGRCYKVLPGVTGPMADCRSRKRETFFLKKLKPLSIPRFSVMFQNADALLKSASAF